MHPRVHLHKQLERGTGWTTVRERERAREKMRPTPMDYFAELEDQGTTVAMDVDDVDPLEIFGGEGVLSVDNKLADADFFNAFEDDFDDADIN
ncbi:small acidic protein 1 [Eucalyptus grandis]|uniref:small acidic protein 1 n=1 Tax=Eucalyptus grandis TaxID=71139 RepID=UPI00192EACE7|nr:small acidic protein 1 [Eucalyptus grandis]